MLLAIDIGNSRIKWALFHGLDCRSVGYFITRDFQPADPAAYDFEPTSYPDLPASAGGWHAQHGAPESGALRAVAGIAVCSVAHGEAEAAVLAHLQAQGLPVLPVWRVRSRAAACGVHNGYAQPERLGADRWAALVAARHLGICDMAVNATNDGSDTDRGGDGNRCSGSLQTASVIVMAGTATTVDALDGDGRFLGGYILPGLRLMPKSLYERTAGIRPDEGQWAEFPTGTADAVASGVLAATAGAVAGMVLRLQTRSGSISASPAKPTSDHHARATDQPRVVLSGGNGPALASRLSELKLVHNYERDLVLHGIARLHQSRLSHAPA